MQTNDPASQPELLVHVGSPEAALAALEAGADALSLPLGASFGREDLRRFVPLAHGRRRKVYVSIDTNVAEHELPGLSETLSELGWLEVDALVLHDLGLWHMCRSAFSEFALHASTRLAAHNSAALRQLGKMGFARACAAPECTLPEIAEMGRKAALPVEVLVQGPLCYSLSGLCLGASVLGAGSGNRGPCGEPCRRPCRSRDDRIGKELHPFSPSDVSLIGRVGELTRAGVAAFRIEGTGKRADSVHSAVRAWRKVLDAPATDRDGALGAAREILRASWERKATEGFAFHPHPREVLEKGEDATSGEEVGEVFWWKDNRAAVTSRGRLTPGDHLGFGDGRTRPKQTLILGEVRPEKSGRRTLLAFDCPFEVRAGDRIFREKSARRAEREEQFNSLGKALPAEAGLPLHLNLAFAGEALHLTARCGPVERTFTFHLPMHEATAHPLDKGVLERHLGRLGETGYRLEKLVVHGPVPPVVIPPSALKGAMREVAAGIDEGRRLERARRNEIVAGLRGAAPAERTLDKRPWVRSEAHHTIKAAVSENLGRMVVPVTRGSLKARGRILEAVGPDRVLWELPVWIPEADLTGWRHDLEALSREGYRALAISNLGHLALAAGLPFELHAGRELHAWNGWAAAALREMGFTSFTLDPEIDRESLRAFAAVGWPLRPVVLVYGELPLFSTRLDPDSVRGVPSGGPVEAAGAVELRWAPGPSARGREWFLVSGGPPLAWTHRLGELGALGIEDFLFDFGSRRYSDPEVTSLLHRLETESGVPNSTEMNFERTPSTPRNRPA